jgi:DNA-binding response OmpR family regulator
MSRVLVVEDSREIAEGLQQYLEDEGHAVVLATKAAHALALAASGPPDLVVLDLGLPDRDGTEVLGELRRRGLTMPVLILSARGTEADKLDGFRLGADDYVTKPFSIREVLARVAVLLRRAAPVGPPGGPPGAAPRPPISDGELRERYGLTPQQIVVARLLGEGHRTADIAERLGVTYSTARNHADQVLRKMGIHSRAAVGAILFRT